MIDSNHSTQWFIYGHDQPEEQLTKLFDSPAPSWREFSNQTRHFAYEMQIGQEEKERINAAIYLRRPLLVTGDPGTGKSSLAHSIAKKLNLGKVLVWPITSRSTLKDALYRYDAIGRLQEANLARQSAESAKDIPPIEKFLTLGPLGTAFADSQESPRILLIDEIDKCDIDLPNDLLYIFEEGEFEIPELSRLVDPTIEGEAKTVFNIRKYKADHVRDTVAIEEGQVRCKKFPIVIMTSNGERELPAPFLRRCLRLKMNRPDRNKLNDIVSDHFKGEELPTSLERFIDHVLEKEKEGELTTADQLMNAIYLAQRIILSSNPTDNLAQLSTEDEEMIKEVVLQSISRIRE